MTEQPSASPEEASAPPGWEADVVVADGGTVHLRPIRPSDAESIVAFHSGLSDRTRYLRYFSAYPRIPERDLYRFTHVDHHDRVAFVCELAGRIIAVGRYERIETTTEAEVAFVVADGHQGRGIGSVLLEHLAAAARECGIRRFLAVVLAENTSMVRVFRDAGYEITRHLEYGEITLEFDVDETAVTERVMREREQRAEARSIQRLLCPRSVAVVGASNEPGKVGYAIFRNLLRMGFNGPLYPVNPDARHVGGVPAYRTVLDVPDEVDLVVVTVPAVSVPDVVEQCAQRRVRGLVVISGGFGERGNPEERAGGRAAQRRFVNAARANGMRVVGPNCLGIINADPDVRLNASLAPLPPLRGRAGFFAQSGALGVTILGEAARRRIGVSTFVSAGSRADVSGNDLLQFWETDSNTDVVLMYLESFGNPRKFARLTRRLARTKPIVAINSGAGTQVPGLESTSSVDLPPATAAVLFEKSGVIRVDTVGELFDTALVLTAQPLPAGDRVAVVGNSTALAVLVRNACAAEGLTLTRMDDVGVDAAPADFDRALCASLADETVDAVVAVFVPPLQPASGEDVAAALRNAAGASAKPIVSTFLGFEGVPDALAASGDTAPERGSVPSYPSPERAVRALARCVRHAAWRRRATGVVPDTGLDVGAVRGLVDRVLASAPDGRELDPGEIEALLAACGLTVGSGDPPDGVATVTSVRDDRSFGALVSFGLAGVATELLGDLAYAPVPLTDVDAAELVRTPRAAPLLFGYEGRTPCDVASLADVLLRLSALADEFPEVLECRLEVIAAPATAVVRCASARVAPATARADTGPRRLRGL